MRAEKPIWYCVYRPGSGWVLTQRTLQSVFLDDPYIDMGGCEITGGNI